MQTDYNKQANNFLKATNTTLGVKEATLQKPAKWGSGQDLTEHKHINYTVTLKNKNHSYTFDFWGSINDYEKVEAIKQLIGKYLGNYTSDDYRAEDILKKNKIPHSFYMKGGREKALAEIEKLTPTAYDIIACLSPMYEDTFEDFCNSFGYDTDSRTAEDTYKRCIEQDRQLYKLFTHEQLEQLAEIN